MNPPQRPRARLLLAALTVLSCLAAASGTAGAQSAPGGASSAEETPATSVPVSVTFTTKGAGQPVPHRFLGLSFEAAALSQLGGYAKRGDLVALLRSLGPGVLRFGGITADENVGWTDADTPPPAWASSDIDPADLRAIAQLSKRSGWKVLLTVGLAHFEPAAAASEVAAAHAALGDSLEAIEIGNEPEAYGNHGYRPAPWLPQEYQEEVSDYREAIDARTPGVPIAGPDSTGSGSFIEWGYAEALAQVPALLTGHHYPLGCAQTPAPSIELLLSSYTRGREARSLETYMAVSQAHRIPLRMDEAGTVSCGGVAGISNTFASSLWAAGYITQTMDAGAQGINLQGNPNNCLGYTPVCATSAADAATGRLTAEPDYYGMLLTRSLVGYSPLATTISSAASPNLVAAAFAAPGHRLKLLLADDEPGGSSPLEMRVQVGAGFAPARLLILTAPAQSATSDVRLDDRAVPADGTWVEPTRPPRLAVRAGYLSFSLPASTAMLVTLAPAPRKRRAAHHH